MAVIEPPDKVFHPFRSMETGTSDIDGMCQMLMLVKDEMSKLRAYEHELRLAIDRLSTGDTKTRRVMGDKFEAKVVSAEPYWSQAIFKELVRDDPDQAKVYLRVATYAANLREVKKMEAATGNERFERFKMKLLSARTPSTSPATVTVTERGIE